MLNWKCFPDLVAAVTLGLSTTPLHAQDNRIHGEFRQSLRVQRPIDLQVTNANGSTLIRTGTSDDVLIFAHISAGTRWDCSRSESQRKVEVFETQHALEYGGDTIHLGRWADLEMGHCTLVDYQLEVPLGTSLTVDHQHGRIEVLGVAGSMSLRMEHGGQIHIVRPGGEVLATATGSIDIMGTPQSDWELATENGNVTVHVARNVGFDLDAEVRDGWIDSNVFIAIREGGDGTVLRGTVNGGGPTVRLRSGHGLIQIDESGSAGRYDQGQ